MTLLRPNRSFEKTSLIDVADLLGVKLIFVREEEHHTDVLGTMRSLIFEGEKSREVSFSPSEHCTVVMVSEADGSQRSCFSIDGKAPTSSKDFAAYLQREPRLVPALRGGVLPDTPIDWMGYK
jgi:hypothetical protein